MSQKIDEMSSMAGGAVEGASAPLRKKGTKEKKKKKKDLEEAFMLKYLIQKGIETVKEKKVIEEEMFRQVVKDLIFKKYQTLLEQEEMKAGERSTAINYLEKVLKMIIPGKVGGSQLEPEYKALSSAAERRSFIKHVIQGLYDEIAPEMSLSGLITRYEQRRGAFQQKEQQPLMEQEDIKIVLDDDGLPKSDRQMEDEELENLNSDSLTTGRVTDRGPQDDFPEPISGENSIGRKAAYRFISTQKSSIENALKDLQMTPEELEVFKSENPNKEEPQVEFLDFLFTNIALHFDRLENQYFNSEVSVSQDFFQDVLRQATGDKEVGAEIATISDTDQIQKTDEPAGEAEEIELDLGEEPEGEEELELDLGEEEPEGEEEELEIEI